MLFKLQLIMLVCSRQTGSKYNMHIEKLSRQHMYATMATFRGFRFSLIFYLIFRQLEKLSGELERQLKLKRRAVLFCCDTFVLLNCVQVFVLSSCLRVVCVRVNINAAMKS